MSSYLQYIWVFLVICVVAASQAFPFPVLRRNMGSPRVLQSDTGYMKRSFGEPSVFAVPSRGLRSPWSYATPFGAQVIRPPQTRKSPIYGIPTTNSMWANSLLQFDDTAPGERTGLGLGSKPEYVGEFYQQAVQPQLDYNDDEDYEESQEESLGMDDLTEYAAERNAQENLAPAYDMGFVPALEDGGSGPRYVEDRKMTYRNLLLPYLLYSAMEKDNAAAAANLRQQPFRGYSTLIGDIKQKDTMSETNLPINADQRKRASLPSLKMQTSVTSLEPVETLTKNVTSTRHTTVKPVANTRPFQTLANQQRESSVIKDTRQKQISSSTDSKRAQNQDILETVASPSSESKTPQQQEPLEALSSETSKPMVVFDRGQKEYAMLRPLTESKANREKALKALSWPKELETDDKEEQKRQLRQLRQLSTDTDSTRHENIDSRRWPAVLDDVDDWLSSQLTDLKSRDH